MEEAAATGQRIWVVDDEPLIRTAMLAVLGDLGYDAAASATRRSSTPRSSRRGSSRICSCSTSDCRTSSARPSSTRCVNVRSTETFPVLFVTAIDDEEANRLEALAPVVRKPFDFVDFVEAIQAQLAAAQSS